MSSSFPIDKHLTDMRSKPARFWSKAAARHTARLFKAATSRVPAYKNFLKKHSAQITGVKKLSELQKAPTITKQEYLRSYTLEDLCWDGKLEGPIVFTSTSGSTGNSFYFPRGQELDWQSTVMHEVFLRNDPTNKHLNTLVVICFGMGVWIGGLITYQAFTNISRRGYPLSIICPGVNKKEIFEAIKNIGGKFEQIILCGYPPFLKDIIDEGPEHGINWKRSRIKLIFAAEAFSENFRDYVANKAGVKDLFLDTMNIYGTADLGTMATETPFSILVRRLALQKENFFRDLFPRTNHTPTLAQYNPLFTDFDVENGQILCTGNNTIPLIRYAIGDHGGVFTFTELKRIAKKHGINLDQAAKEAGIFTTISELPFVYVYERADLSTKLYGAIIYPEHIKEEMHRSQLAKSITGKFTLVTKTDKKHNEYLEVNVELRPKIKPTGTLKKKLREIIHDALLRKNAEHRNNASLMPNRVKPKIALWQHEHPIHFKPGIKQKWAVK